MVTGRQSPLCLRLQAVYEGGDAAKPANERMVDKWDVCTASVGYYCEYTNHLGEGRVLRDRTDEEVDLCRSPEWDCMVEDDSCARKPCRTDTSKSYEFSVSLCYEFERQVAFHPPGVIDTFGKREVHDELADLKG